MTHEFVSGIYGNSTAAWHKLGKVVAGLMTTADAIRESGVGYAAIKVPVYLKNPIPNELGEFEYVESPEYVAVVDIDRQTDALGIHSDGYEVENFADAFLALGNCFGADAKLWETMILLRGGKIAAGVMKLPDLDKRLADGSNLAAYIAAYTSHDGSYALTYTDTNVRIECANKLRLADSMANGARTFRIKHTSSKDARKVEVTNILTFAQERIDAQAELCETLLAKKLSERKLKAMVNELIPIPTIEDGDSTRGKTRAENRQSDFWHVLRTAPDLDGMRETAWGFVNAGSFYTDHVSTFRNTASTTRDENRFIGTVLKATGNTVAERALEIALKA